jgi:hypothetical protein
MAGRDPRDILRAGLGRGARTIPGLATTADGAVYISGPDAMIVKTLEALRVAGVP